MFINGSIHIPNDVNKFPLEGLQCTVKSDLVFHDGTTIFTNSDVFLHLCCKNYHIDGHTLLFEVDCQSFTIDGEYSDYHPSGEYIFSIIKNSYLSDIILCNDYTSIKDKFKIINSFKFDIGGYILHKKYNNIVIC